MTKLLSSCIMKSFTQRVSQASLSEGKVSSLDCSVCETIQIKIVMLGAYNELMERDEEDSTYQETIFHKARLVS